MATITTRVQGDSPKGSPLTNAEVDNNFINLNTAKYESGDAASFSSVNVEGTGGITVSDGSSFNYTGLLLKNTGTAASANHNVQIRFHLNAGSTDTERVRFTTRKYDSGDQNGMLTIDTLGGGTLGERIRLDPTQIVLNEPGLDMNFRVESDSLTHALFVDASNDSVSIGTSAVMTNGLTYVQSSTRAEFYIGQWSNLSGDEGGSGLFAQNLYQHYDPSATPSITTRYSNDHPTISGAGVRVGSPWSGGMLVAGTDVGATKDAVAPIRELLRWHKSYVYINEEGADVDFKIETSGQANGFVIDGGGNFAVFGNTVKNIASGFADQHGVGIDLLTGKTEISADTVPLSLNRTTTAGNDGTYLELRGQSSVLGKIGISSSDNLRIEAAAGGGAGIELWGAGGTTPTISPIQTTNGATNLGRTVERFGRLHLQDGIQDGGSAGSETVFNDDSTTADFRVESDNNTHLFYVDAGVDKIAVGKSVPRGTFNVAGPARDFSNGTLYDGYSDGTGGVGVAGVGYATMYLYSTDSAAQDRGAALGFRAESGNTLDDVTYAIIGAAKENATTDGSNGYSDQSRGYLSFHVSEGYNFSPQYGTRLMQRMKIDSYGGLTTYPSSGGHAAFNENGYNSDFRVETDTHAHALFVDASESKIGLWNSAPTYGLDVLNTGRFQNTLYLGNNSTTAGDLQIFDTGNNLLQIAGIGSNAFQFDMLGTSAVGYIDFNDFNINIKTGELTVKSDVAGNEPTYKGHIRVKHAAGEEAAGGLEFHTSSGGGAGYGSRITSDTAGRMFMQTRKNASSWTTQTTIDSDPGTFEVEGFDTTSSQYNHAPPFVTGLWTNVALNGASQTLTTATFANRTVDVYRLQNTTSSHWNYLRYDGLAFDSDKLVPGSANYVVFEFYAKNNGGTTTAFSGFCAEGDYWVGAPSRSSGAGAVYTTSDGWTLYRSMMLMQDAYRLNFGMGFDYNRQGADMYFAFPSIYFVSGKKGGQQAGFPIAMDPAVGRLMIGRDSLEVLPGKQVMGSMTGRSFSLNDNNWRTFGRLANAQGAPIHFKVLSGHNSYGGYGELTNDSYAYGVADGTTVTVGVPYSGSYGVTIRKIKRNSYSSPDGGWEYQIARNNAYGTLVWMHVMGAATSWTWTV